MKKSTAVILLLVSLLLIAGGIVLGVATGWSRPGYGTLVTLGEYDTGSLNAIQINSQSASVCLYDGSGRTVTVDAEGGAGGLFSAELRGNTLVITQEKSGNTGFRLFGINFILFGRDAEDLRLVVWLPQSYAGSVAVSTDSGDISLNGLRGRQSLSLATSSGDVDAYECRAEELNVATSSGDVYLGDSEISRLLVTASSGQISLRDLICASLMAETSSGDVWGSVLDADSIGVRTSSGDVILDDVERGAVELNTASGSVALTDAAPESLSVRTGSGDVDLVLLGDEKAYTVDFSSGSGELDGSRGGKGDRLVTIRTSSGDADVSFED
ncbi:MAG: DUF4097 family beta strand repeat protein [Oscillospiraceae bacterium]|nr:DUF4097 family beta strand repeat protein [Oscillospiraceae bacterium]